MVRQAGLTLAAGFGLAMLLDMAQRRIGRWRGVCLAALVALPTMIAVLAMMLHEERMAKVRSRTDVSRQF